MIAKYIQPAKVIIEGQADTGYRPPLMKDFIQRLQGQLPYVHITVFYNDPEIVKNKRGLKRRDVTNPSDNYKQTQDKEGKFFSKQCYLLLRLAPALFKVPVSNPGRQNRRLRR